MANRFNVREKGFKDVQRRLDRMPREVRRELKKQAIEKAGLVILRQAKKFNYGFRDRSGDLRNSIRLGRPKNTQRGVQIPIVAGRTYRNNRTKAHYAGFVEFGTEHFLQRTFLRKALRASGINALYALQKELRAILSRLSGL